MFDGGYLIRELLLREGLYKHITSPEAVSDTMLNTVNLIQETPRPLPALVEAGGHGGSLGTRGGIYLPVNQA